MNKPAADKKARGGRAREVIAALKVLQKNAVGLLNDAAESMGFDEPWDASQLSRVLNGHSDMTVDQMTTLLALDPKGRSWSWLLFGVEEITDRAEKIRRVDVSRIQRAETSVDARGKARPG